jgi:hypothetical protein
MHMLRKIIVPVSFVALVLGATWYWRAHVIPARDERRDRDAALEAARGFDPGLTVTAHSVEDGIALAGTHCVGCHLAPPVDALPVASWLEIFPMKYTALFDREQWHRDGRHLAVSDELATRNTLTKTQFATIVYAYLLQAPKESVPQFGKPAMSETGAPFEVVARVPRAEPEKMYMSVAWDPYARVILAGDATARTLDRFTAQGAPMGGIPIEGTPTGISPQPEGLLVTSIGKTPFSFDQPDGDVTLLPRRAADPRRVLLANLHRPVRLAQADFNGDGEEEYLVPEFGFTLGSLSLYDPAAGYRKRVLIDNAGTVAARAADVNGDGKPDVVALVGQNQEMLYVLTNDGYGNFATQVAFQGHPSFGSNALAVGDLNNDGRDDLVTAVGDNFDLRTQPLKNYHGLRVFTRRPGGGFALTFFYPMHGAIDVQLGDYDGDGDRDMVAVAIFPDLAAAEPETFVYLENVGGERFVPHRFPAADRGRWISVASQDINGDGRDDLVLAAAYSPMLDKGWDARFGAGKGDALLILQALPAARAGAPR